MGSVLRDGCITTIDVIQESIHHQSVAHGVVLVEAVKFRWLHLFESLLPVDLSHGHQCFVSRLRVLLQVQIELLLVTKVGIAGLLDSKLAQACETSGCGQILVSLHDLLIVEAIRLR